MLAHVHYFSLDAARVCYLDDLLLLNGALWPPPRNRNFSSPRLARSPSRTNDGAPFSSTFESFPYFDCPRGRSLAVMRFLTETQRAELQATYISRVYML